MPSRLLTRYTLSMERATLKRLRWRLRGAWYVADGAFVAATVADEVLMHAMPVAKGRIRRSCQRC